MKRVRVQETWPESWKYSYTYDLAEVFGEISHRGYAYAYQNRCRTALRLITDVLPTGSRILDIAAAQGNFSLRLAELGYHVTWNDLRADLADYVRLKHEHGNISFAPGNAFEINFPTPFDAVLITEVIEHVAHPDDFLRAIATLVRPRGYVVMTTPNGAYFKNRLPTFSECSDPSVYEGVQFKPNADGHIFLLHPHEVEPMAARAALKIDQLLLFTNPLTNGHMKMEVLLRLLPKRIVEYFEAITQHVPFWMKTKILVQMGVRFIKQKSAGPLAPGMIATGVQVPDLFSATRRIS
jgi:2-polyprenyl-3-methyl-5-hydroxy-6-metoxy-1,4-benzoquinol methylase